MAVATPCWPAPVSAITRGLPIRCRQQRLADRVVDLVGAGVGEVLALQVDGRADPLGEPLGQVERRRAADEVAPQQLQPGDELGVLARLLPGRGQLVERRDQRLRHVAAPVGAEPLLDRAHRRRDAGGLGGLEEGGHRRVVLAAGLGLDAAGDVDGVGLGDRDRRGDVVRPQAAGEDVRDLGAMPAQQLPVEALAGAAPEPLAAPVEEVEVGPVGLGAVDVGGAGDVDRLDHLDPGPPRHLGAELSPLGPVQLHHRQARVLDRLVDLLQGRVDEDARRPRTCA